MKTKICGIQSIQDARIVLQSGADFIGINFVRNSKRFVTLDTGREIIQYIHSTGFDCTTVGVFQNQTCDYVNMLADNVGLDFVQLHGDETPEFCIRIERPVIKAFALEPRFDIEKTSRLMGKYHVAHFLVDRHVQGEGELVPIERLKELAKRTPFFLAGGLTPDNVQSIACTVNPFGLDVAGGVESDQKIDKEKVNAFIISCHFREKGIQTGSPGQSRG